MLAAITLNLDGGQILFGLAALATALSTMVVPYMALRASRKTAEKITVVEGKVDKVEITTNSLSERAEALARLAGQGEGEAKGRAAVTAEHGAAALAREQAPPATPPSVP